MKDTKIVKLLILFTKDEFRKFGLFVSSPYFNRLNNVIRLYEELKKHYPDFNKRNLRKENIFNAIFPEEKYNDIRMRALQSYLFSLAEKFLSIERYSEKELEIKLDVLEQLKRKRSENLAQKSLDVSEEILAGYSIHDADYYYDLYKVLFEKNSFNSHFSGKVNLQKEADAMTVYYIIIILRVHATAFNRKTSLLTGLRTGLIETVEDISQKDPYKRIPAIKINYALYMMARYNEDEKYFFEFIRLADKYPSAISPSELFEAHFLLLNFCVVKIQKGNRKFIAIKFELYKKMLDKKLFDTQKYFQHILFNNIVTSALENENYKFAENFIEKYKERLSPDIKKDVVEICYAKIFYRLKSYDKALEHLSKTGSNEDIFYKLAIKDLSIKIYYETDKFESVFSLIDTYKHFLHNNELLSEDVKARYGMFLKMLNELLKTKLQPEEHKPDELKNILLSGTGFVNKDWILEKLDEI